MNQIQRLRQVVLDRQKDLDREQQIKKTRLARDKEKRAFFKLMKWTKHEFFCTRCQVDFSAPAYKVWNETNFVGSWHSFCPFCGITVYRHATSKKFDPYYEHSEKVRQMRGEAFRDMVQPGEYGFRMMYGDPFEHYYKRFQEHSQNLESRYASMGMLSKLERQEDRKEEIVKREMEEEML